MSKDHHDDRLADEIGHLACEIKQFREQVQTDSEIKTILQGLVRKVDNIMEAITQFAARVNTAFDAIGTSVDEIVTSQAGLAGDVAGLKALVEKLQNTQRTLTPEDQALLDAVDAKVVQLQSKTAAVSAALKELDDQTENVPTP